MAVKIGHAVATEKGKATGGKAGDQTGKEVRTQAWYKREAGWLAVYRPKDKKVAEAIAKAMEAVCANDCIGYDQGGRYSLYDKAKAASWDISKVKEKCECDCSSLIAVCINAAGVWITKYLSTATMPTFMAATGAFEKLTDKKYLEDDSYLQRGDILWGQGHTAAVLTDGDKANTNEEEFTVNMRTLKKGDKGDDVRALQILLAANGCKGKMIESGYGSFGANTANAVKLYQKKIGVSQTGTADETVWKNLLGIS